MKTPDGYEFIKSYSSEDEGDRNKILEHFNKYFKPGISEFKIEENTVIFFENHESETPFFGMDIESFKQAFPGELERHNRNKLLHELKIN